MGFIFRGEVMSFMHQETSRLSGSDRMFVSLFKPVRVSLPSMEVLLIVRRESLWKQHPTNVG
ncbi:hypothetical protein WSS15_31160 [Acetobacter pasteurianus]|nr:hypothetical protein WSS15_31160 [Acetobacter pasteurianus]